MSSSRMIARRIEAFTLTNQQEEPRSRELRIRDIHLLLHFGSGVHYHFRRVVKELSEGKLFLTYNKASKKWTIFSIPREEVYAVITDYGLDKVGVRLAIATAIVDFQDDLARLRGELR